MNIIDTQIYQKNLERSSKNIQEFILKIYSNINFLAFIDRCRPNTKDKQLLIDIIRGKTSQFLLGLISEEDFISSIIETLNLNEEETDPVIEGFYSTCLPDKLLREIQYPVTDPDQPNAAYSSKRDIDMAQEKTTPEPLSHHDILSEIENPTPSNLTIPGNKPAQGIQNPTTPTASIAQNTTNNISTSIKPALEIGFSNKPHTNPAENIVQKLDAKLTTPSASIPKEVFVPKKTDPYREPVL